MSLTGKETSVGTGAALKGGRGGERVVWHERTHMVLQREGKTCRQDPICTAGKKKEGSKQLKEKEENLKRRGEGKKKGGEK